MLAREGRGGTVGGMGSYDWGRGGRGGAESSSCGSHRARQDSVTHGATTHAQGSHHLVQSSGPRVSQRELSRGWVTDTATTRTVHGQGLRGQAKPPLTSPNDQSAQA